MSDGVSDPVSRSACSALAAGGRSGGRAAGLALGVVLASSACARMGQYMWVDSYEDPRPRGTSGYVIASGDVLFVRVYREEGMSGRAKVRPDGKISLPFVNDVEAAGLDPGTLSKRLESKLREFIVNPVVTVSLEEMAPVEVSVVGEVARPGVYRLDQESGVLRAIAMAGGLGELASRDRIFVLRSRSRDTAPWRIRFTYERLAHAEGASGRFRLVTGDVVVE